MVYWGFLGVYKCIWSTWRAVTIANLLTDPRRNPPRVLLIEKEIVLQDPRIAQYLEP